jgi:flagellar basal-body rod protein FlgB
MTPVYLFGLASRHAQWASLRQVTISGNVANANTPGYEALDVTPFTDVMNKTQLAMARTSAGHLGAGASDAQTGKVDPSQSWDITHSGNTVSLDQEMVKAGEVNRAMSLNTSIVKSFHRMMLSSVRSGA